MDFSGSQWLVSHQWGLGWEVKPSSVLSELPDFLFKAVSGPHLTSVTLLEGMKEGLVHVLHYGDCI